MDEKLQQAVALHRQGHLARAQNLYEEILERTPEQPDALHLLGVIASQTRNHTRAVELISKAIQIDPGNAVAYSNRGIALQKLERWDAALFDYDHAIAIRPDLSLAYCNRGNVLKELKQWDAALASYDRAIEINPGFAEAHSNRGAALQMLNRCVAALESLDRALEIKPDYPDAHCNRGNVLKELGQWEAALASYDRAIALQADHTDAHCNRGLLLQQMNRLDAALESFDRAIASKPDHARAYVNRSMARLVIGDFENGWEDYEWRRRLPDAAFVREKRDYAEPRWTGEQSLRGKAVLLHAEQGLGDTLQFCRYAQSVAELGAVVILEVPAPLRSLLTSVPGVTHVLATGEAPPAFDFHCSLMSLPWALRTTLRNIPAAIPYLRSDAEKQRFWRGALGASSRRRVGLVWSGGFRPDQPDLWSVHNRRNIPLAKLAVLQHPDIEFFSLQKGQPAESELEELVAQRWNGPPITNLTHLLHDFSDTAALIEQLDLVITVDTATAHLAGALGKPVWILNRHDTCWRWLLERTDSPWYPTATLYRQERPGDWEAVVERVRQDLARALSAEALSAEALTLRGLSLAGLGRSEAALESYDAAIACQPDYVPAHINRGVLLRRANRQADALSAYDTALAMRADSYEARLNRAAALTDLGNFAEALADCDAAVALQPQRPETHVHRAVALTGLERFEQALGSYGRALELRSDYAEAHAGIAGIYLYLQRPADALPCADRAIALAPSLAVGHFNRGAALRDLKRIDEAVTSFEAARALQPDDPRTNANLAGLRLLLGRFEGAWDLYEWRSQLPGAPKLHRYPQPRWRGEDIRGKTLFVYLDQGLGDTIQFSRYAKLAEQRGARVVMSVQRGLRRLLSSLSPTIQILSETEAPDAFDHHCPLASLPRAFETSLDTIPVGVPYLRAEPERVAHWRQRLGTDGFKIGVCWQGSTVKTGVGRSFPLRELEGIASLPGVRLISLQRDVGEEQLATRPVDMKIETLGDDFDAGPDAFLDTAAVMESLDLVITCDTSIAHVAGALGRPAWVALKLVPDWRWMLDREDNPWYPSLRLYRQTEQGRWANVFDAMRRALGVPSLKSQIHLAGTLEAAHRFAEALAAFTRAVELDPTHAPAHAGRARALAALGEGVEAIGAYRQALLLNPRDPIGFVQMGQIMLAQGFFTTAHSAFSAALELVPDSLAAEEGRVKALLALNRHEEAVPAIAALRRIAPYNDYLQGHQLHAQLQCADWRDYGRECRDITERVRRGEKADLPLSFIAYNESAADQYTCAATFTADRLPAAAAAVRRSPRAHGATLRIAYLSPDFREHPVAHLMAGVIEAHDKSRFETYAFSAGPDDGSETRRRIQSAFDHFEEVAALSDSSLAERMADLSIDIAVDLAGHTMGSRTFALARRPAPLQVAYLGFPGTLGAEFIDYIIADRHVIPESAERHYAEKVIYLPDSYLPGVPAPAVDRRFSRADVGLPAAGFVYCCFNAPYKISPSVFDLWMRILAAVPDSIAWLRDGPSVVKNNLAREAERRGVNPARLVFAPKLASWSDHCARLGWADLFLDTSPYNAHTTASDALAAGVPLISLRGETFAARVATSLLHAIGLEELAVDSGAEYERLAIELAQQPQRLAQLKVRLLQKGKTGPLFDTHRHCRHLEAAYEEIWARYRRGEVPSRLAVRNYPATNAPYR